VFSRGLAWLRGVWAARIVTPLVCQQTVDELLRVMAYQKFNLDSVRQEDLLGDYLPFAESVILPNPLAALPVACRDAEDDILIHLAITAQADFLVTGDKDLLALAGLAPVRILGLAAWRAVLA
jgi:putative PIN family toxin of toxin-antitoxin system